MWNGYEGKYFEGRDFYDWGLDLDLQETHGKFKNEIETLAIYSSSIIKSNNILPIDILNKNEKELLERMIHNLTKREISDIYNIYDYKIAKKQYPKFKEITKGLRLNEFSFMQAKTFANMRVNFNNIHYKMVLTHLCTILDECLSGFIKAIAMYYNGIVENINIRTNITDIEKIENRTDMREYFIDNALKYEKNFSGVIEKTKFLLNKYCSDKKYDYSKILCLKVERDCIIHRNGKYDKKAMQLLGKFAKENEEIILNDKKIRTYISESIKLINFLEEELNDYYFKDFKVPPLKSTLSELE